MKPDPLKLIRPTIAALSPYSSARDEYKGNEGIFLDANENPFNNGYNRYPDPYQWKVKQRLSEIRRIPVQNFLLGNGSDEVIDLLFRAFCVPAKDNVILLPPTYGMYKVSANINDVEVREVQLDHNFQPDVERILSRCDSFTKLLFVCSPNNPTGNLIRSELIEELLERFPGMVVVDEAYIDFCPEHSMAEMVLRFPNLVVMQTLSKAWGLAGIRLGIMIANADLVKVMNKIKPPYNINSLTQETALKILADIPTMQQNVITLLEDRILLEKELQRLPVVSRVHPSDANFLLVRFVQPQEVFLYLIKKQIIVRDRSNVILCDDCLRITIGTPEENHALLEALKNYPLQKIR
ncbi:MAG TPA: histidinol-phosphate transaminase [Flavobacteriales bacterium]|nr:histidinol-phosphate transaminase [Flavobacteriales bacterium]HRJ37932.1 histidinol-phosphate transaminase [Flavobacteriales bacterium]